jgi:hypothetical protein
LRRSQRISKAEGEDEGEDEEEEVLLTSTQQKALQSQTIPPIQQTQQRQMAQQTQQTPPIQQTQQRQTAQQTPPSIQQTQQRQTAQQTQQLSAQAHPSLQQFLQLQQSQQSQATASGSSQMSATSSSTPIFIDSDDREIIIRSRSRATTPGVETDILAEFEDFGITRPGSVGDRSPVRSRRGTPAIDVNIEDIAPSSTPTGTKRRDSTRDTKSIEALLVKQGRQICALYELQKSTFEKVTSIQNQLKKTSNKNIELSSKVFSVSNNLITDNNIIIILVITFRYLTV